MTRNLAFMVAVATILVTVSGCLSDETIRVAYVTKDTATAELIGDDLDGLKLYLEEATGRNVRVDLFFANNAALEALRAGQADIASVDGAAAWLGWKTLDLEAVASNVRSDGRTYYMASAWVRTDSDIETIADLEGRNSCHTGATKSAGMFMPMSYLVQEGLIDASEYPDDISSVATMAQDFFDEATIGGAYEGYEGGLRCLSEGVGDVAFIRDTTPADYCDEEGAQARDWCLDLSEYRELIQFGQVPEHPFMVSPHQDAGTIALVTQALVDMDESDDGVAILETVFGTSEIRTVTTEQHLGNYGGLISHLPGISKYAAEK